MAWIAISDHSGHSFAAGGLGNPKGARDLIDRARDGLMAKGSLVIETRMPTARRPRQLLSYQGSGDWPFHLSLHADPGGGLVLILDHGGEVIHRAINHSDAGRMDVLRITYAWDSPRRWGQLALERSDQEMVPMLPVHCPSPLRVEDALALIRPGPQRHVAPDVLFVALSDQIEPVGPMPSLCADVPIATPHGYRPVCDLQRGDMVLTDNGCAVPVLHVVKRTVPASGSLRPVWIRAPYYGLAQDICVAPTQRLVLSGSEVEYLFGQNRVLVSAGHLDGTTTATPDCVDPVVTYWQVLLPAHETLIAAGTVTESLFIGRLHRKKTALGASLLAGLDRRTLPDHGQLTLMELRPFDASVLAETRVA